MTSVMARRMVRGLPTGLAGYVLADANYDDNPLFDLAQEAGLQLLAPRRRPRAGLGWRRHSPSRLRSIAALEAGQSRFGPSLHHQRGMIERRLGTLVSTPELNPQLPPWVRGYQRVRRWIELKLIAYEFYRLGDRAGA